MNSYIVTFLVSKYSKKRFFNTPFRWFKLTRDVEFLSQRNNLFFNYNTIINDCRGLHRKM